MDKTGKHPFIAYLEKLADQDDRGALAALRRGLGQSPGVAPEMFRYVVPFVPRTASRNQEAAYYLVASLFALHPHSKEEGNMGEHMAQPRSESGEEALERRFTVLLSAHVDDLPFYLRQAISFLKSKEVAVNWNQLLSDLLNWDHPDHFVQKAWARSFWERGSNLIEEA